MYRIFSDGGSRGNPGPSAYAIVVTEDGRIIHEHSEFLGICTNNCAEYRGLIAGLTKALELGAENAEFIMDSELVVRQMNGEYKVRNKNIMNLYLDAKALSSMIPKTAFRNVRRSELLIPRADALLNEELDRHQ
ncbi:MAG: ribonuclease HI family protein [Candidatus Methanoplasma sp.]|jgi:ribonuclease HI|nr:ribonuclease HI family protein [Candidatus Methanoplasma sp.]